MKKGPEYNFSKVDMQVANRYSKGASTSLMDRELEIETITRYHLTYLTMAVVR